MRVTAGAIRSVWANEVGVELGVQLEVGVGAGIMVKRAFLPGS